MITNRPVGLWMLPAHVGTSRSTLAALQRDFARIRALQHPHIAQLLELGHNGQQYYVTGERLDGEPLREVLTHLAPERLDAAEADEIVRAIGSALAYAHEHGVAHGDVRAENVLVTMDRRFVLTNFLTRRTAKVSARPPRPADDVKALARLAAELYTGSISPRALRHAFHGPVPAARLNAIRGVLEGTNRRSASVADFLEAAGLRFASSGGTLRQPAVPTRAWSFWRVALPMAAIAALAIVLVSYYGGIGAAQELKVRGLDALRAVAARMAPAVATDDPEPRDASPEPELVPAVADDSGPGSQPPEPANLETPDDQAEQPAPQSPPPRRLPAEAQPIAAAPVRSHHAQQQTAAPAERDPTVLSLGTPRIAAREDHSVVAIEVIRTGDTSKESAVGWWTTPDTAHAEDDYANLGRQTLKFPAGATVERVLIPIVDDGRREGDEAFTVHMGRPQGGVAGTVTATRVMVYDDD